MVTPHEEATTGDRHGSPLAVSNIAESICPAIPRERQPEHSVQKKHNRAKPMSELLSALISIADSSEFRFARFNIVYEGAQLVLPESPPIVSGVSDMCPPVCPNVEETRNQLQSSGWKKYAHFFPTNAPAAFLQESGMLCFLQYCLPPKNRVCLL